MQEFENILDIVEASANQKPEPMDITPYFADFTKDVEKPVPVISDPRDGRVIVSEENIFTIAGAAKSRKSFLVSLLTVWFFRQNEGRKAVLIDTEQAEYNVIQVARRVCRGMQWDYANTYASGLLRIAHLRPYSREDRLEIVEQIIAQERPYLCIIDGCRDLVSSVNEDQECSALIDKFMKWTTDYKCCIGTVVHTNKDGETLRGHLGSELINKSEVTLFCKKGEESKTTEVTCHISRNIDFEKFELGIDEHFVPYMIDTIPAAQVIKCGSARQTETLKALGKYELTKIEWLEDIRRVSQCTATTAEKWFNDYVTAGYLKQMQRPGQTEPVYGHFGLYGPNPIGVEHPTNTLDLDFEEDEEAPF